MQCRVSWESLASPLLSAFPYVGLYLQPPCLPIMHLLRIRNAVSCFIATSCVVPPRSASTRLIAAYSKGFFFRTCFSPVGSSFQETKHDVSDAHSTALPHPHSFSFILRYTCFSQSLRRTTLL